MEKILKNLPDLMISDNMDELQALVKNPDAFTIRSMTLKKDSDFSDVFNSFRKDVNIAGLFEGLDDNDNIDKLIDALKQSDNEEVQEVADFIKNELQNIENIDLENKTLSSILWSSVVYKYLTEKRNHAGITAIDDIFEKLAVCYVQCLGEGDVLGEENSIQHVREEVFSIFEKTAIYDQLKGYFSTAFIKNRVWAGRDDFWFDNDKFEPIKLSTKSYDIQDTESLLVALQTPTANAYKQAIDYVAKNYCGDGSNNLNVEPKELIDYKAHLIVSLLASSIIKETQWADFEIVEFNLVAKTIAKKQKISEEISKSNIAIDLTNKKERNIINIADEAMTKSLEILKELGTSDKDEIIDEELPVEASPIEEEKKSKIKYGSKKAYVDGYLKLFGTLIDTKRTYYKTLIRKLSQVKSAKAEELVENLAQEFNVTLKTEEEISIKNLRTVENAKIVGSQVRNQLKELSIIDDIFGKVRRKKKDVLDIENITFDQRMLGDDFYITEEAHKVIIREFYSLIADDSRLKSTQETYRLAPKNMNMIDLKERAEAGSKEYPFFAGALSMQTTSKKDLRERIVDKLYVNEDGSLNEDFENLYNIITDAKASANAKKIAVLDAKENGILDDNQVEQLFSLLETKKSKKTTLPDADQLTIDFSTANNDSESENE